MSVAFPGRRPSGSGGSPERGRPALARGPEDWRAYRREMWRRRRAGEWGEPAVARVARRSVARLRMRVRDPLPGGGRCARGGDSHGARRQLGPVTGAIAVIVVVAALVALSRGLRRSAGTLDALLDATARVEAGDYSVRVPVPERGMRPVRQLVRGFDTMVERLERDEDQRRTLLNDVSHELRTPLTVIAGNLEAMIDGVHAADEAHLTAILEETRVMERLIDDLRTVALSEAGTLQLHREPTDPDVLIDEVVRSFAGLGWHGRGDRHGRRPVRPADHRRRPGPDPGGARQSRGERRAPHTVGRHGRGPR